MEPMWTGDLDDDCTALWQGLMLRAEEMETGVWWWAVRDQASGEELASSNLPSAKSCQTGSEARQAAEEAAASFRNFPD